MTVLEDMPPPEQDKAIPLRQPIPRFISLTTDAIQEEFKRYQDHQLSLSERVRAGHRLLATAAYELNKRGELVLATKIVAFLKLYSPPRIKTSIVVTGDKIPVRRVYIGGPTEEFSDFPLTDEPERARKFLEDQQYEKYYGGVLAPIIGHVMSTCAKHGIVPETPEDLDVSFEALTAPIRTDDEGDDLGKIRRLAFKREQEDEDEFESLEVLLKEAEEEDDDE